MVKRSCIVVFLCALCAGGLPVSAQQSVDLASVSGRVTDQSGAVVAGAQITVRHTQTNVTNTAVSDREGRFRFPYLRIGPYEIVVRQQGFQDASRQLRLMAGAAFELPVTLRVGALGTSVTVKGDATVLEAARSQVASTVSAGGSAKSSDERPQLPRPGAARAGRVAHEHRPARSSFRRRRRFPASGLSVGSQRNLSNNFIVDGLSANDDAAGLSGIPYGVDAIEEFQVVTSGAQAELGRALGGYVNVVTKSGTNVLHGDRIRLHARRPAQRGERALADEAADGSGAVRRKPRRSAGRRPRPSISRTSSSGGWIRPG